MGFFYGKMSCHILAGQKYEAGRTLGKQFEHNITSADHRGAFGLLALIGGKMATEALKVHTEEINKTDSPLDLRELCEGVILILIGIKILWEHVGLF